MILKIGISGKRNITANEMDFVRKQIENSISHLLSKNKTTQFIGYTGLAKGADTIFAEVVTEVFKQPLHVILPFSANGYENDFTDPVDLDKFKRILTHAQKIETLSNDNPANKEQRNKAYFDAGKYIADTCDDVIFVWDELKPRGNGGTAEVMSYYCEKKNKINVPYITTHPENEDLLNNQIIREYELSNDQAIKSRNNYKKIWNAAIFLGWLPVILFAIKTGYHWKGLKELVAVSLEFLLVVSVFILIFIAKKKGFHGRYLKERMRAETFRILKYFYHANIEVKISSLTINEDKELSEIAQKINNTLQGESYKSKWYANYIINNLIEDQKKYHSKKINDIGGKAHFFENVKFGIGIFFLINLCIHLVSTILEYFYHIPLPVYSHEFTIAASIALPASYAAIEGILYFQEWELLKKYAESAEKSLKDSMSELPLQLQYTPDDICFAKQSLTLNLVSSIMLTDNKNWRLILEDKNNYQLIV